MKNEIMKHGFKINDVFTVGPNLSCSDRSFTDLVFMTTKSNGQYVKASIIEDNKNYLGSTAKNRQTVLSICLDEYGTADGIPLLSEKNKKRTVLFRRF